MTNDMGMHTIPNDPSISVKGESEILTEYLGNMSNIL